MGEFHKACERKHRRVCEHRRRTNGGAVKLEGAKVCECKGVLENHWQKLF